ncbi:MAG TPA: thioredoxin family protein [Bacteroidales bacterium]|nr:thioredoxin family protein [Bacteroidales bacterium]
MKLKLFTIIPVMLLVVATSCGTSRRASTTLSTAEQSATPVAQAPAATDYHNPTTWLLGYFDPVRLRQAPYSEWYLKGMDDYMPKTDVLNKLFDIPKDDLSIKIVMGSWCPDSRREVPRFMKILELWQFPAEKVTFVGVDEEKNSPVGDFASLNIVRVPTFIFYKNNSEAGRIIEVPRTSLEQDMVNILSGNE